MIYAMSDIHGCMDELEKKMEHIELGDGDRVIFLGDYIDYGRCSGQVLRYLYDLQHKYGDEKVVVLMGNHEAMLIEWIEEFNREVTPQMEALAYDSWLRTDAVYGYNAFRTLVTEEQFKEISDIETRASFALLNTKAVKMILETNGNLIKWLKTLPSFYETEKQIFVHAGVDEEAEEYWKYGTGDEIFLWRFPATLGKFCKTVIAGHIGTAEIARDRSFHDIYYDGESHYYIDGSVYRKGGKLLMLGYDEAEDKYLQIEDGRRVPIFKYVR